VGILEYKILVYILTSISYESFKPFRTCQAGKCRSDHNPAESLIATQRHHCQSYPQRWVPTDYVRGGASAGATSSSCIHTQINDNLGAVSIERVNVYGRQIGEGLPVWNQDFELVTQSLLLVDSTATQSVTFPATQNKQPHLKELVKKNNVKQTTNSKTHIKHKNYENQMSGWVNLRIKPFIASAYSKIWQLPIFVKYGAIAVILLLLSIKFFNIIKQSQPISGKMYIVLGKGATSIPDNNIEIVKCDVHSDKCQKIEAWLNKLTIPDPSIGTNYVKLYFLTKWADILMLDDSKKWRC